jgi:hypothetical protein
MGNRFATNSNPVLGLGLKALDEEGGRLTGSS